MAKASAKKTPKASKSPVKKTPAKKTAVVKTVMREKSSAKAAVVRTPAKAPVAKKGKPAPVVVSKSNTKKPVAKQSAKVIEFKPQPAVSNNKFGNKLGSGKPGSGKLVGKASSYSSKPEPGPGRDIPVAPPVPTDGKPRKNLAGMNVRELEHFRELLLLKRRELVGDISDLEREALRTSGGSNLSNLPLHMADMGTDNYEQEFTLGLVEKDRQLLREINNALAKIQSGAYGICEGTGKPISKARLEAQPWAKFSIEWARQLEQRQMIRR